MVTDTAICGRAPTLVQPTVIVVKAPLVLKVDAATLRSSVPTVTNAVTISAASMVPARMPPLAKPMTSALDAWSATLANVMKLPRAAQMTAVLPVASAKKWRVCLVVTPLIRTRARALTFAGTMGAVQLECV